MDGAIAVSNNIRGNYDMLLVCHNVRVFHSPQGYSAAIFSVITFTRLLLLSCLEWCLEYFLLFSQIRSITINMAEYLKISLYCFCYLPCFSRMAIILENVNSFKISCISIFTEYLEPLSTSSLFLAFFLSSIIIVHFI